MLVKDLIRKLNSFPKTATVTFEYPAGDYGGNKNITPVASVDIVEVVPFQGIYREPKYDEYGDIEYPHDETSLQFVVVLSY
jgi:hypothetical protein